jgi:hypothetical protein
MLIIISKTKAPKKVRPTGYHFIEVGSNAATAYPNVAKKTS